MSEKKETFKRLDDHRDRAHLLPFDIGKDKFAVFSDLHKWNKSKADFFESNEEIYLHALAHYLENDYNLVLNGDIEELAGSRPETVVRKYKQTFEEEKKFLKKSALFRIYGNHDHDWKKTRVREKYLQSAYGSLTPVFPAIRLGENIIILHGHEGDLLSDEIRGISNWFLRLFKKTFTIITGKSPRAAKNHKIRKKREEYLHEWAKENHLLLISGHTHRPVFMTSPAGKKVRQRKMELQKEMDESKNQAEREMTNIKEEMEEHDIFLQEYDKDFGKDTEITAEDEPTSPNFFNCGCGVFKTSITAIEIDSGVIRLIRWYKTGGEIKRDWTYLKEDLAKIFKQL